MQLNAIRRNTVFPELYRHTLDIEIDRCLTQKIPVSSLINAMVTKATVLYSDKDDACLSLQGWFDAAVDLCPARGVVAAGIRAAKENILDWMPAGVITFEQKKMWVNHAA